MEKKHILLLTTGGTIASLPGGEGLEPHRSDVMERELQMLRTYGLTGIGLGPDNFIPLYAGYSLPQAPVAYHSHMLYLEVWLEMGLIGIVSFLGMYLGIIRRAVKAMAQADSKARYVLIACVSSLAGVSFAGAAEYIWFYPRILFAFFIIIGVTLAAVKLAEESR